MYVARKDVFFDYDAEKEEQQRLEAEDAKAKASATRAYVNRVIFHPNFKNISYNQLVAMEPTLEVGGIVIRPSRQGTDHLTVSLKIDDGILKHFDVMEKDKTHSFALGRTLVIGTEEFEDLDEIVARFLQPMVYLIREVYAYKYYRDSRVRVIQFPIEKRLSCDKLSLITYAHVKIGWQSRDPIGAASQGEDDES